MSESVFLQIGRTGIQKGSAFWEALDKATPQASSDIIQPNLHPFYQETRSGKLVPRTLLFDLESRSINSALSRGRDRYLPHLAVFNQLGSHSLYSRGFYSSGAEIVYPAVEAFRRQAEAADSLQNIFVISNLGGGSGSGFTDLLLSNISDEFPGPLMMGELTYCSETNQAVLPTYNTVLSVGLQVNYCTLVNIRQSSRNQAKKVGKVYIEDGLAQEGKDLADYTACMRYPGTLNSNMRKAVTNLIPFPRMHFTNYSTTRGAPPRSSDKELLRHLLHKQNLGQGKDVTVYSTWLNLQGDWSEYQVEQEAFNKQNRQSSMFVDWIASNISLSYTKSPAQQRLGLQLANSNFISLMLRNVGQTFTQYYRRKAGVHAYLSEGMDDMQFTQAESNLNDLVSQYIVYDSSPDLEYENSF